MQYVMIILLSAVTAGMVALLMSIIAYILIKKAVSEEIEAKMIQNSRQELPEEKPIAAEERIDYIDSKALLEAGNEDTIKKRIVEEDESDILTGSDLSKHMPKTKEFEELNIPTLEEISVAELDSNDSSKKTSETKSHTEAEAILTDIPNDLTDEQNDDEATVLMHRKPPE